MRIYENTNADDYYIRNVDDENVVKYAQNIPCHVIDFSLKRKDVDLYLSLIHILVQKQEKWRVIQR